MKKLMKGAVIGVLGLGLALGAVSQASAMPGYKPGEHTYDDSCKTCHPDGDPNGTSTTPSTSPSTTPATTDNNGATTSDSNSTALPQTGAEGIYLNYLAGAGLLVPGAALLASRKRKH